MAVFEIDPHRFIPAGFDIEDGGADRLPRTFYTPAVPPPRAHEQYMVAIVEPIPPPELVGVRRQQVLDFLVQVMHVPVLSAQTWYQGVGLFEMEDPVVRGSFTLHPPFPLGVDDEGNEFFVRFIPHNQGEGFRAIHGQRTGWLMFIGIPLDYRNTQCIADMVGSFGQFHYWNSTDRRKVRSLVRASFPDNALVPRSVTFREFANWGDVMVSWSAGCYILSGEFAGAMIPADEDPMPLNGNPHPLPGVEVPQPFWAMPPYPALGWNAVPPGPNQGQNDVAGWADNVQHEAGWGPWEEQVQPDQQQHEEVQPAQDQNSMILNPSVESFGDEDMVEVQQPLQAPPIVQLDPIHLGMVRVFYGPVLPPAMIWERSFQSLLPEFFIRDIPACLPGFSATLMQVFCP